MTRDLDYLLQVAARTLIAEGHQSDAELLRVADAKAPDLEHAWDSFSLHLEVTPDYFAELGGRIESVRNRLQNTLNRILAGEYLGCDGVFIKPVVVANPGWRTALASAAQDPQSASTADDQAGLLASVERQRMIMQDVATGGTRIADANPEYEKLWIANHQALETRGLRDPNTFRSLWDWYDRWRAGDMPTYQSRRAHLRDLYAECVAALSGSTPLPVRREPTGWAKVDRQLDRVLNDLGEGSEELDFQGVGHAAREVLISLAEVVYDPSYPIEDGTAVSDTDAKRRLDAFFNAMLGGRRAEAARKLAKAAVQLADATQHKRSATHLDAAMAAEAAASVVRVAHIVARARGLDINPERNTDAAEGRSSAKAVRPRRHGSA